MISLVLTAGSDRGSELLRGCIATIRTNHHAAVVGSVSSGFCARAMILTTGRPAVATKRQEVEKGTTTCS